MPRVETVLLNFQSLADLDGERVSKLLMKHLARIAQDCIDRPEDDSRREVVLKFGAEPIFDPETHGCETVKMEVECNSKVPIYRTKKFEMRVSKGGFLFNKEFPDAIDQPSLFEGEQKP